MTPEHEYFLSMILIIGGSVLLGFWLGHPYWFSKGLIEGIQRGGEIWDETLSLDDDNDESDDRVLDAKEIK